MESYLKSVAVILLPHELQAPGHPLGVTMFAAGADLVATSYGVPGRIRPFDGGVRGHAYSLLNEQLLSQENPSYKNYCICFNGLVAVPQETLWPIEPHTVAKHQILRKYLDAWLPILGTYNPKIVYIDGFSGPGQYSGGEPGSPLVALEAAGTHRSNLSSKLVFLFVEERADRVAHLKGRIATLQRPSHFEVRVEQGTFAEKTSQFLDALDAEKGKSVPTFALIDPFGFAGIQYSLIRRLVAKDKCEFLITFMVDSINRWLEHPDENIRAHIIETFGTEEAIEIAFGTGERAEALKSLYHRQLKQVARFVRYFEMRDRNKRIIYYLFFASNNSLGHLKMKEAMWKVDPMGDFRFSDATNANQFLLFDAPTTAPLADELNLKFRGAGQVPVADIETYVNDHTAYLGKHMREALLQLEVDARLQVAEYKKDGGKRRARTYPKEALVTFL